VRRIESEAQPGEARHLVFRSGIVFEDPDGLDLTDHAHSWIESRSFRIGTSEASRISIVVYMVRRLNDGETVRIISARRASRKEREAYARREH